MPVNPRVWRERPFADDLATELVNELAISPMSARILAARKIHNLEEAKRYLAKRLADVHNPSELLGMDTASTVFATAINKRETILIHGDYDVDGSTATTLLVQFIRELGLKAVPWIPHAASMVMAWANRAYKRCRNTAPA